MTESDAVPIQHEYVTNPAFVGRLTRAFMLLFLVRPQTILLLTLSGVLVVAYGFSVMVSVVLDVSAVAPTILFVLVLPLLFVTLIPALIYRQLKKAAPIGSRYAIGLGDSTMRIEAPLASSVVDYRMFRDVRVIGGFVFLRLRSASTYSALPLELLPGEDLDRLRQAVSRAKS